ncbi:hypothetical protein MTO96_033979 [Rhipicephalus appendiculatus]
MYDGKQRHQRSYPGRVVTEYIRAAPQEQMPTADANTAETALAEAGIISSDSGNRNPRGGKQIKQNAESETGRVEVMHHWGPMALLLFLRNALWCWMLHLLLRW